MYLNSSSKKVFWIYDFPFHKNLTLKRQSILRYILFSDINNYNDYSGLHDIQVPKIILQINPIAISDFYDFANTIKRNRFDINRFDNSNFFIPGQHNDKLSSTSL